MWWCVERRLNSTDCPLGTLCCSPIPGRTTSCGDVNDITSAVQRTSCPTKNFPLATQFGQEFVSSKRVCTEFYLSTKPRPKPKTCRRQKNILGRQIGSSNASDSPRWGKQLLIAHLNRCFAESSTLFVLDVRVRVFMSYQRKHSHLKLSRFVCYFLLFTTMIA